jgi:hypothetical protein
MDRAQGSDTRPTFLVERYWPGIDLAGFQEALRRLEAAARQLADEGSPVEHLGSILMPADQVVFSLMAANDESVVRLVNERAGLPADRIAGAIALPGERPEPRPRKGTAR